MNKKTYNFSEFLEKVFPFKSPFQIKELGFITNLIKFLSLRIAFILYKIGISANLLNVFGLVITFVGFILIYNSILMINLIYFILGYSLIAISIFIDFIDGPLSKINHYVFAVGGNLDNLAPDIILIGGMLIIGYISQHPYFFILMAINSIFYLTYVAKTFESLKKKEKVNFILLFNSRYSLFSMRVFCSGIFPLTCLLYIFNPMVGEICARILIIIYTTLSLNWLRYSFEDKFLR